MTEKQIYKRMNEAWDCSCFARHDDEAEWYANPDDKIWVCDIPSLDITVKMELSEEYNDVIIYQAPRNKQSSYDYIRDEEWEVISHYSW